MRVRNTRKNIGSSLMLIKLYYLNLELAFEIGFATIESRKINFYLPADWKICKIPDALFIIFISWKINAEKKISEIHRQVTQA